MKELSIEEKARRYDEILARAEGANLPYYKEDIMSKVKEFVDYLLPELQESEDERIKNFISNELACLRATDGKGSDRYEELTNAIAWLEKQGKHQKFRDSIQVGDKVTRNKNGILVNLSQLNRVAKKDNMQGEQIDLVNKEYWRGYREGKQEILDKYSELEKQKGANGNEREIPFSTWCEEDEKIYSRIYNLIRAAAFANYDVDEDGKELGEYAKITDWFKSLKERVGCEANCTTTWKPSDERMEVLVWCMPLFADPKSKGILESLINDLKKLKG